MSLFGPPKDPKAQQQKTQTEKEEEVEEEKDPPHYIYFHCLECKKYIKTDRNDFRALTVLTGNDDNENQYYKYVCEPCCKSLGLDIYLAANREAED